MCRFLILQKAIFKDNFGTVKTLIFFFMAVYRLGKFVSQEVIRSELLTVRNLEIQANSAESTI